MGIVQLILLTLLCCSSQAQVTNVTTTAPEPPVGNTTGPVPPVGNTTSPAPPVGNTTGPVPPVGNTTSPAPPVGNTTSPEPPVGNTTSPAPPVGNTTGPVTPNVTTEGPAVTTPKGSCITNPCPSESKCEELADGKRRCLCPSGLSYNENANTCEKAKVFPGDLTLKIPYDPQMENTNSAIFKDTSDKIVNALKETFKNTPGYLLSVVISLRPNVTTVRVRVDNTPEIIAKVENIFETTSDTSLTTVQTAIEGAAEQEGLLQGASFKETDPCVSSSCNALSTGCKSQDGLVTCICMDGFAVVDPQKEINCTVCPSGKKAADSVCTDCSFGRTGFNCEDNYLLIIVIVASALGGLLLISMSVTAYAFLRKGKRRTDKPEEENMTFGNLGAQKSSNSFPMIPRVGGGGNNDIYSKRDTDSTTNTNGYSANTSTGLGNNNSGVVGLRAQTGQGFNRGANMSYLSNTPTSTDRGRTYEEPKSFGLPRANQSRANPYDRNPYDDRRNPY